jgi:hypothetical protein
MYALFSNLCFRIRIRWKFNYLATTPEAENIDGADKGSGLGPLKLFG